MSKNHNYRLGVGAIVINRGGLVFVGKRNEISTEAWQLPQGGIDEGEIPEQAIIRELEEEIGTNNIKIICEMEGWYSYDIPREIAMHWWGGKYIGQKQKWFVVQFLGSDHEINVDTQHPEFVDWKWVDIETISSLAVSFKRKLYEDLTQDYLSIFPTRI